MGKTVVLRSAVDASTDTVSASRPVQAPLPCINHWRLVPDTAQLRVWPVLAAERGASRRLGVRACHI